MKFTIISILLYLFFPLGIFAQTRLDSLEKIINSKKGTEKVKWMNRVANDYINSDLYISERLSEESFRLSDNLNDIPGKAVAAGNLGLINYLKGQLNQSEYYCKIGKDLASSIPDFSLERDINTTLGLVYSEQGNSNESLELFRRNIIIDSERGDTVSLALDYQNQADATDKNGSPEEALKLYFKAQLLLESAGNTERLIKIYNYIGRLYLLLNRDSAKHFLIKSFSLYKSRSKPLDFYDLFWNLSLYYSNRGNPDSSIYFLQLGKAKAQQQRDPVILMKFYQLLSDAYEKSGMYSEAYQNQKYYLSMKDSLDTLNISSRINDHIRSLENENKQQTFELLRKEAQIKDRQWLTADVLYYLLFGGIFMMLFIFIAFYARYKLYKKSIASNDKLKQDLLALTTELAKKDGLVSDIKKREEKLIRKNRVLGAFVRQRNTREVLAGNDIIPELKGILSAINGDVAGLYLCNENRQLINLGEYDIKENKLRQGSALVPGKFPLYFESIKSNPFIISGNCRNDPRYAEFLELQFKSGKNVGRIDYPIKIEQKLLGVLYVEKINPEEIWTEKEIEIIEEKADIFLPVLTKTFEEQFKEKTNQNPDWFAIKSVFQNLKIVLLEKNQEGFIFHAFPDKPDGIPLKIDKLTGNNWLDFLDASQQQNLINFYKSIEVSDDGNPSISYDIFDSGFNKINVKEVVKFISYVNGERRIKSLIYFESLKETTDELKFQANSFKAIIASLLHGLVVFDEGGKILMINPAAEKMTGFSAKDIISGSLYQLVDNPEDLIHKFIPGNKPVPVIIKTKSGEKLPCNLLLNAFLTRNKKYFSFEFYIRGYKTSHNDLKGDGARKQPVIHNLTGNRWFLLYMVRFYEFILTHYEGNAKQKLHDLAEKILIESQYTEHSERIVEFRGIISILNPGSIRDIPIKNLTSRIFEFENSVEIKPDEVIRYMLERLQSAGNGRISFHGEFQAAGMIKCDPVLLAFVVYHLLLNSIKSINQVGDVYLKTDSKENKFSFVVIDTGEGISPEIKRNILTPVILARQEHKGSALYFVKNILNFMGGEIRIRSQMNKGTEVYIEIPSGNP